jgi:hypothetical protein
VSWSGSATMARPLSKGQIKEAYQGDKGKNMASYQILYWFDIPVQVRASIGRNRRTVPLTNRFVEWYPREDSNLWPLGPQPSALIH